MKFVESLSFDDVLLLPQHFSGESRKSIDISTRLKNLRLEIPIIAANMPSVCEDEMAVALGRLGGLGIIHRMQSIESQKNQVKTAKDKLFTLEGFARPVGAAIGVNDDWKERVEELVDAGADIFCLDVAHAVQQKVGNVMDEFQQTYPDILLIVGNFSSYHTFSDVDIMKIGIGGGSLCTTRIKTGCGEPTFQSVWNIHHEYNFDKPEENKKYLIADGGIKNSGDIVKSLAAGAHAVMLGSLLAGTTEAPGEVIKGLDGKKYKVYRGSASYAAKRQFGKLQNIEGEETLVPYRGSVADVVNDLIDGIRSGFSYCGALNLNDLQNKAKFIKVTTSGLRESKPHGLL